MYPKVIFLILFPLFAFSQSPQKINFQSILRNNNGEVVANKNVKLKISIQSGSMMDTTVYSETHFKTTDASGLMSLKIGTGTIVMGRFDSIKWGKAPHFIKLEADFNGGNSFVLLGTQELMSVPYAFHSNTADSLVGGSNKYDNDISYLKKQDSLFQDIISLLQSQIVLTDIDGNSYKTVILSNMIIMAENLRVSHYKNGDPIPIITQFDYNLRTGARTWANNDSISNEIPFGNLYNAYAAIDARGLCPAGWHIPSNDEWFQICFYSNRPQGDFVLPGLKYWIFPNTDANNKSKLSLVGGGFLTNIGSISSFKEEGLYWSSTRMTGGSCNIDDCYLHLLANYTTNSRFVIGVGGGVDSRNFMSIRCIKDY